MNWNPRSQIRTKIIYPLPHPGCHQSSMKLGCWKDNAYCGSLQHKTLLYTKYTHANFLENLPQQGDGKRIKRQLSFDRRQPTNKLTSFGM
jgi:hypothetical protein